MRLQSRRLGALVVCVLMLSGCGTWSVVASPSTSPAENNELHGVTCVTRSDCWAVGFWGTSVEEQTLAEHWDGGAWSIVSTPTGNAPQEGLNAVACTTASDCWAVGARGGTTLAQHWDGKAWSIVPTTVTGILFGVACVASSDCWAIGTNGSSPVAEHWDGSAWSLVTTPGQAGAEFSYLYGVACAASSDCWALGYATNGTDGSNGTTLAEHWNGTAWSIVASPDTALLQNEFFAVACTSGFNCWAVGLASNGGGVQQPLAEHWNGTAWSIVDTPSGNSVLLGVACANAWDCWAVGAGGGSGIDHWDGRAWSIVSNADAPLNAVTCVNPLDCWAVGFVTNGTVNQTLTEHLAARSHPR